MSIDLEKAFDRVSHEYLWRCLEKFNFPEPFIRIVRRLYTNANSRIQINGSLTISISIRKSVRQGCPLRMILFVIYIEPLLRRMAEEARGVVVGQDDITALSYTDDINYIVQDDKKCDRVSQEISRFCIESNYQKLIFLRINKCKLDPDLMREDSKLKVFGFHIWNGSEENNSRLL
jgi:hypothetical protein